MYVDTLSGSTVSMLNRFMSQKEEEYMIISDRFCIIGDNKDFGSITKLMGFRIPHIINSAHINEF